MNVALEPQHRAELIEHARRAAPEECCGLLVGIRKGDCFVIRAIHPTANVWAGDRGHRFEIDPRAQLAAQRDARERRLEIVGYYHSHPDAAAIPSDFDTERAWEEVVYLIISLVASEESPLRAWVYDDTDEAWSEASIN